MARQTPRLNYTFPDLLENDWFNDIVAFFIAVDANNWASSEDQNLTIHGAGTINFSAGGNSLSWTAPILTQTGAVGITWSLPAGTVTVNDGQILWIQVDRTTLVTNPTALRTVAPNVTNTLLTGQGQSPQDLVVLGFRDGSNFYWRNGTIVAAGTPSTCLSSPTGGGAGDVIVFNEVPPQMPDGTITDFSTTQDYATGKIAVYRDGVRMTPTVDFTFLDPTHVRFLVPPTPGSNILFDYARG